MSRVLGRALFRREVLDGWFRLYVDGVSSHRGT